MRSETSSPRATIVSRDCSRRRTLAHLATRRSFPFSLRRVPPCTPPPRPSVHSSAAFPSHTAHVHASVGNRRIPQAPKVSSVGTRLAQHERVLVSLPPAHRARQILHVRALARRAPVRILGILLISRISRAAPRVFVPARFDGTSTTRIASRAFAVSPFAPPPARRLRFFIRAPHRLRFFFARLVASRSNFAATSSATSRESAAPSVARVPARRQPRPDRRELLGIRRDNFPRSGTRRWSHRRAATRRAHRHTTSTPSGRVPGRRHARWPPLGHASQSTNVASSSTRPQHMHGTSSRNTTEDSSST